MPTVSITKAFTFEAAHVLPRHPGKCSRMHGHSYLLEVTVTGPVQEHDGMVIDFDALATQVKELVIARVDHRLLNELVENPTAENLALQFWSWMSDAGLELASITLHETATNRATVTP